MLDFFQNKKNSWMMKILIILICSSLIIIFFANMAFRSDSARKVLEIGDKKMYQKDLLRSFAYQRGIIERTDDKSSDQLINEVAFDRAIEQEINRQLLLSEAYNMGLKPNDKIIQKQLEQEDFLWKEENGKRVFDREQFNKIASNLKLSDTEVINMFSEETAMRELIGPLSQVQFPSVLAKIIAMGLDEKRKISFIKIPSQEFISKEEPKEKDIIEYYEKNKLSFIKPEYRSFDIIEIDPKALKESIKVTPEDIKIYYENNINEFKTSTSYDLKYVSFEGEKAEISAAALYKKIIDNKLSIKAIEKDKSYKVTSSKDIPATNLAENLKTEINIIKADSFTKPINMGENDFRIYYLEKIIPEKQKPQSEVTSEITETLKDKAYSNLFDETVKQLESDTANSNSNFKEIAEKISLGGGSFPEIDRKGNDTKGQKLEGISTDATLVKLIFSNNLNISTRLTELDNGNFVIAKVTNIKPSYQQTLEEVRKEIIPVIKEINTINKAVIELDKITLALNEDKTTLASYPKYAPIKTDTINFSEESIKQIGITDYTLANIFSKPKDTYIWGGNVDMKSLYVIKIEDIIVNEKAGENIKLKEVTERLGLEITADSVAQLISYLREIYPVYINRNAFFVQ